MANERENNIEPQQGSGSAENLDRDRSEQFNELSELSLEERMAVADQIGVPVYNVGDAAATGTAIGVKDSERGSDDDLPNQNIDAGTDR